MQILFWKMKQNSRVLHETLPTTEKSFAATLDFRNHQRFWVCSVKIFAVTLMCSKHCEWQRDCGILSTLNVGKLPALIIILSHYNNLKLVRFAVDNLPAESFSLVYWRCVVVGCVVFLWFCIKRENIEDERENEAEIANLIQISRENDLNFSIFSAFSPIYFRPKISWKASWNVQL